MHARFVGARGTQLAIALGDLDRARTEAQRIAAQDEPDLLPPWRSYLEDVRAAAAQVVASQDTITAAKTTANLGRTCARCHEAAHADVVLPAQPATIAPGSPMATHQWAAARMWEGLIGPSDSHWSVGARVLAETAAATSGDSHDAARMKALAEHARGLRDHDAWVAVYGDLLATCAHCHAVIRDPSGHVPSLATEP
jgi:cytochrome c553